MNASTTSGGAPRILIIRLSALGDVVMASGLIPSVRARWPDAHLAWLTEPAALPLLKHNPRLDEVLVLPRAHWTSLWRERRWRELAVSVKAFRTMLRARSYDLVLDAQGLLKSALCAWFTNAPRRIGLAAREGGRWLVHERPMPDSQDRHLIGSEYRYLARYLGVPPAAFRLDLAVGETPRLAAHAALDAAGVTGPYAALCPFTTRPQKHWFEDRWSELAQRLSAQGLMPVVLGGLADAAAAGRIAGCAPAVVNLVGRLALDESVAVIGGAGLLVGVDTGLTHVGTALGIPTVALFGSTRPYLDAGGPGTCVMYDALPCSPCRRRPTCHGRFDCMRQLSVDRVFAQALVQRTAARAASAS
jgi:heptosyltransferase-1